jgi:hypothetical protein
LKSDFLSRFGQKREQGPLNPCLIQRQSLARESIQSTVSLAKAQEIVGVVSGVSECQNPKSNQQIVFCFFLNFFGYFSFLSKSSDSEEAEKTGGNRHN